MKRKMLGTLLIIFSFLKGTFLQTTSAPASLEGTPTYLVIGPGGDQTTTLNCAYAARYDEGNPPHRSWMTEDGTVVAFNNINLVSRLEARLMNMQSASSLTLKIDPVQLTDEGLYACQLSMNQVSLKSHANLSINQFPTIRVKKLVSELTEGDEATIASCHADLSKPRPKMWFEDSKGNKFSNKDGDWNGKECGNGLTNTTIYLTKTFTREDMDETYSCKIKHENKTTPYSLDLEKIYVRHPPSVSIVGNDISNSQVVLEEGSYFSVDCGATGYPEPDLSWTFVPDVVPYSEDDKDKMESDSEDDKDRVESDNVALHKLPSNFIATDGNKRLLTQSLQVPDDGKQTNNGTFTCTASNGVGSDSSLSFHLQVFAIPTTTAAPTTAALPAEKDDLNTAPHVAAEGTAEPQQAGPSAALVAGIVAVAVFVLIVTVIFLLRYFMSHKGEYYTNELKRGEDLQNDMSDNECDMPTTDAELLGEKKRTEHFL